MSTLPGQPIMDVAPPIGHAPPLASTTRGVGDAARDLTRQLTWLKPPWRSLKRAGAWLFSTFNLMRAGPITRVQVGCGKDIRAGWWNIDLIHFPGIDEIRDATLPWRHHDLDYVFAEHFIEHLSLHEGIRFLTNAGRALKVGGTLRLSTPNLSNVVQENYQLHGAGRDQRLRETVAMNCCFHGFGHQFLYSQEFLRFILEHMGFDRVHDQAFGLSDDPNLCGLERHGPYDICDGIPSIITFEARRGSRPIEPSPELTRWLDQYFDDEVYR